LEQENISISYYIRISSFVDLSTVNYIQSRILFIKLKKPKGLFRLLSYFIIEEQIVFYLEMNSY